MARLKNAAPINVGIRPNAGADAKADAKLDPAVNTKYPIRADNKGTAFSFQRYAIT